MIEENYLNHKIKEMSKALIRILYIIVLCSAFYSWRFETTDPNLSGSLDATTKVSMSAFMTDRLDSGS